VRARRAPAARARRATRAVETRDRLIEVALELFAERGFRNVTVRDISQRAHANLAAISYHFGDKLGLYTEIVDGAIARMRALIDSSRLAGAEDASPEDRLRRYIRTFLLRAAKPEAKAALLQRLMRHELADPTDIWRRVIDKALVPRLRYLTEVIAAILDCPIDDERVRVCAASIQAQCMYFARDRIRSASLDPFLPPEHDLEKVAEYVAEFSIAGVHALRRGAARGS
jgi:AcrR family transcriptional regulator